MESLGEKLKNLREQREWDYDYISRETNISKRYLEALEKEDFSCFPAEPYLLGFLKNYGNFLGCEESELLSLYHALKIQEQPAPMDVLLRKPSPLPKIIGIVAALIVLAGLIGGGIYLIPRLPQRARTQIQTEQPAVEYLLSSGFLERRFYPGDSVIINDGDDSHRFVFTNLSDAITLNAPRGPILLDLGQEVRLSLGNDAGSELSITVADFARNDAVSGALLRFEQTALTQPEPSTNTNVEFAQTAAARPGREMLTILPASPSAYPFTLQAVFQSFCLFRYEVLFEADRPERSERVYQRTEQQNITAQNGIRLGVSNAQAVRLQVMAAGNAVPVELGSPGEVVAADLRWVRDQDGRFRLVLIRLE